MERGQIFESIRIRRLAGLIILCMAVMLIGFEVLVSAAGIKREEVMYETVGAVTAYFIPVLWLWRKFKKKDVGMRQFFFEDEQREKPRLWEIIWITAVLLCFSLGVFILTFIPLSYVAPEYVRSILEEKTIYTRADSVLPVLANVLEFITGALIAPVIEEIIFRGVMLNRFMLKWNVKRAVIISSVIFGLLHFDLIGAFMFGVVMSILYLKTRSLTASVMCHILNNTAAYGFTYLFFFIEGKEELYTIASLRGDLWMGVAFVAASAPFLFIYFYKSWRLKEWEKSYKALEEKGILKSGEIEYNHI